MSPLLFYVVCVVLEVRGMNVEGEMTREAEAHKIQNHAARRGWERSNWSKE